MRAKTRVLPFRRRPTITTRRRGAGLMIAIDVPRFLKRLVDRVVLHFE